MPTAACMLLPARLTQADARDVLRLLRATAPTLSGTEVVIDAGGLQQFDSTALAVLLACRRQALELGRGFALREVPQRLRDLAEVYGLCELLPELR